VTGVPGQRQRTDSRPANVPAATADHGQVGPVTRRTARNAAYMVAAELCGKAATLVYTLLAARMLSQLDFGAFSYALSFATLLSIVPDWGFDMVVVQRSSARPDRLPRLRSLSLTWKTVIGVPVLTASALLASLSRPTPQARTALCLLMAAALLDVYSNTNRASAAALQCQGGIALALAAQRILTAVLAVAALLGGLGLVGLTAAYLAGSAGGLAATSLTLRRLGVTMRLGSLRLAELRGLFVRAWWVGVGALVLMALFRVDMVILGAIKGDEAVAAYATAYRLLETMTLFTWTIARAVLPVMSASSNPARVRRGVEQGIAVAAFIYIPFAAVSLLEAPAVIRLLFGATYTDQSAPALRWLAFAPLLFAVAYYGVAALLSQERSIGMVTAAATATAVNIGLNLALVPSLAGTGAAVATTLSYLVESVVAVALCRPVTGRVGIWRPLLAPAVAGLAMATVLASLQLQVVTEVVLAGAAYLLVWFPVVRRAAPEQLEVLASLRSRRRPPSCPCRCPEACS
jgi:O-antigen/teichoic acid export membrane protein